MIRTRCIVSTSETASEFRRCTNRKALACANLGSLIRSCGIKYYVCHYRRFAAQIPFYAPNA
ncbi:hypothetical protein J6590_092376 [Homalodisca vitripennis]|nr:hypothetical protein J6590_092376 [Homalodisca vitripennis]